MFAEPDVSVRSYFVFVVCMAIAYRRPASLSATCSHDDRHRASPRETLTCHDSCRLSGRPKTYPNNFLYPEVLFFPVVFFSCLARHAFFFSLAISGNRLFSSVIRTGRIKRRPEVAKKNSVAANSTCCRVLFFKLVDVYRS